MTRDLLALRDWLEAEGVTHVAMEATGVLWKPVYTLLEGRVEVLLVNAHHVKQVEGRVSDHHRFLLKLLLEQYDGIDSQMGRLTGRIEEVCGPFAPAIKKIAEMPGYDQTSGQNVVAEIGMDMSRLASDDHLCSWATICPGNHESAGKQIHGRTVKGNRRLKAALCQSAWAAARAKDSYFGAQFHRLAGRRGKKRAIIAVAHAQWKGIYHLLSSDQSYKDLGPDYFLKLNAGRAARYHRKVLESMGYTVIPPGVDKAA